jgi:hypothetical protein
MTGRFISGFGDELIKEAKYPISRLITSRQTAGYLGAKEGIRAAGLMGATSLAGVGGAAAGGAALRALHQHLIRTVGGRALHGRLVKGGKGLMGHEKEKLGEALGVSGPKLDKMIASYAAANKGGKTHPLSRAASTKWTGIGAARRIVDTRAMAGRAARGGAAMTGREKDILKSLAAHGSAPEKKKALMALGTAGAVGTGAAIGTRKKR